MPDFIEINLLPVEDRKIKKDYSYLFDARVIVPILALAVTALLYWIGTNAIQNDLKEKETKMAQIQADINANQKILAQIKQLEKLLKEKNAKNQSLKSISLNKQLWVRLMEALSKSLPPNTWINEIKQLDGERASLSLSGIAYVFSEIAYYMLALEKDAYLIQVNLESIEIQQVEKSDAFKFLLTIMINSGLGSKNTEDEVSEVKL